MPPPLGVIQSHLLRRWLFTVFKIALVAGMMLPGGLEAQFCWTPDDISGPQKKYGGENECDVSPSMTFVKLKFYLYSLNGFGIKEEDLPEIIATVNENYASSFIQFYYEECETEDYSLSFSNLANVPNGPWLYEIMTNFASDGLKSVYNQVTMQWSVPYLDDIFSGSLPVGGIHVHLWDIESTQFLKGATDGIPSSNVMVQGEEGSNPSAMHDKILTHELGHALGLYHTYHGSCEGHTSDINTNDYVEDTGLDPFIWNQNVEGCEWTGGGGCYFNGPNWNPDVRNFMNYVDECEGKFTECQNARMKGTLQLGSVEVPVSCDCFSSEDIIVNSSIEWKNSMGTSGDVIINSGGKLKISSIAFFSETTKITVKAGGELILDFAVLMPCTDAGLWEGISLEDGAVFRANNSKIKGAEIGLDVRTKDVFTNLLSIKDCVQAINIEDTGIVTNNPGGGKKLVFTNVDTDSPVNISNSLVQFKGCHFTDQGNIKADWASLYLYPSEIEPNRRCDFVETTVAYLSGPRFQIDESNFENSFKTAVTIKQCEWFTACRSRFKGKSILADGVGKYDVFLNLFLESDGESMKLNSGSYTQSAIRDNLFADNPTDILSIADGSDLRIFCNLHEGYALSWDIRGKLQDQGDLGKSAQNVFQQQLGATDISSEHPAGFTHFYQQDELYHPTSFAGSAVGLGIVHHSGNKCDDELANIIEQWENYERCYNEAPPGRKSFVVCCTYHKPPPPPTEGGTVIDVREKVGDERIVLFGPNPVVDFISVEQVKDNSKLTIHDNVGRTVFTQYLTEGSHWLNLESIISGTYTISLERNNAVYFASLFQKL